MYSRNLSVYARWNVTATLVQPSPERCHVLTTRGIILKLQGGPQILLAVGGTYFAAIYWYDETIEYWLTYEKHLTHFVLYILNVNGDFKIFNSIFIDHFVVQVEQSVCCV